MDVEEDKKEAEVVDFWSFKTKKEKEKRELDITKVSKSLLSKAEKIRRALERFGSWKKNPNNKDDKK
jgi:hypothetical protein